MALTIPCELIVWSYRGYCRSQLPFFILNCFMWIMISFGFTAWKEIELCNSGCFSLNFITLGWFWWVKRATSDDVMGSGKPISAAILTKYLLMISATLFWSVIVSLSSLSVTVLLPLNFLSGRKGEIVAQKFLSGCSHFFSNYLFIDCFLIETTLFLCRLFSSQYFFPNVLNLFRAMFPI